MAFVDSRMTWNAKKWTAYVEANNLFGAITLTMGMFHSQAMGRCWCKSEPLANYFNEKNIFSSRQENIFFS